MEKESRRQLSRPSGTSDRRSWTSGIASWRRTLGHERTQTLAGPGQHTIERVNDWRQPKQTEDQPKRAGKLNLGKEYNARSLVPRHWRPIAEYEPPTFAASLLGHRAKQAPRFLVREREQCEFLASIERGDDPRRPAAEPSAAGVEQNRARKLMGFPVAHNFPPMALLFVKRRDVKTPAATRAPYAPYSAISTGHITSGAEHNRLEGQSVRIVGVSITDDFVARWVTRLNPSWGLLP